MKKKILIPILFIFIVIIWLTIAYYISFLNLNKKTTNKNIQKIEKSKPSTKDKDIENVNINEKINTLRKRSKLKWLIIKWDIYLQNEQLALALKNYLNAYKQNPKDEKIIKKIWDTYFEMKKYKSSYNYYSKILDYKHLNKEKLILSLFYYKDLKSITQRKEIEIELNKYNLEKDELFYYKNSLKCIENFHLCKKDFNKYFDENKEIKDLKLIEIKKAIQNYQNFQIEEIYYKNALIIWAYFINKLYPLNIILWEDLLKEKENYQPIIKILWKSYYELWNYKKSRDLLAKYYTINDNDAWVVYLLWIIQSKLHEYILSNIYLNKAIEKWYTPNIDVRRRLIHNYYLLWNIERLLSNFKILIENGDFDKDDLSVAIYYHIINKDFSFAIKWSKKWIELYPKSEIFYWYLWWIYKEQWNLNKAKEFLEKGLKINPNNPLLLLNMWYLYKLENESNKSVIFFKKTIKINWDWEFWKLAKEEIKQIQKEKNIIK